MGRVGIFVDAGYLFAEGAKAIAGETKARFQLRLEYDELVDQLRSFAIRMAPGTQMLRIYWYDGARPGGMSAMQRELAYTDGVKMRFGLTTRSGRQKGVDGLIVADLIELAHNRAITDAILVSGDEDTRIGVQLSQSYGVRVHLLGIGQGRKNQSNTLRQEADTVSEWSGAELEAFLSVTSNPAFGRVVVPKRSVGKDATTLKAALDGVAEAVAKACTSAQLVSIARLGPDEGLPGRIDGRLLATSKDAIGRFMNAKEKWYVRNQFKRVARRGRDAPNTP